MEENTKFPPFYSDSGKVLSDYILEVAVQIFINFYLLPIVDGI